MQSSKSCAGAALARPRCPQLQQSRVRWDVTCTWHCQLLQVPNHQFSGKACCRMLQDAAGAYILAQLVLAVPNYRTLSQIRSHQARFVDSARPTRCNSVLQQELQMTEIHTEVQAVLLDGLFCIHKVVHWLTLQVPMLPTWPGFGPSDRETQLF